MTKWKLTDTYEMGYEYECPDCGRHIVARFKGKDLPDDCPYCGSKMTEITTDDAIRHFEYGVSHDIFYEPVTTYAKMAISALREQEKLESNLKVLESSGWISVEKRLPENERERVLVLLDSAKLKKLIGEPEMDTDRVVDGRWVRWNEAITHWMPLPLPPKEEV